MVEIYTINISLAAASAAEACHKVVF